MFVWPAACIPAKQPTSSKLKKQNKNLWRLEPLKYTGSQPRTKITKLTHFPVDSPAKSCPDRPDFQANYGEILEKLNFAWRPRLSRARINDFIATATKGHITGHLRPADVTSKTNFVVADAAYLHGNWTQPFDRNATKAHEFRGYDRVGVVQMMEHSGQYQFGTCA